MRAAPMLALVATMSACAEPVAPQTGGDEPRYLDFVLPLAGLFESTGDGAGDSEQIHALIDAEVSALIAKIGAHEDGMKGRLGFHYTIPIWAVDGRFPGKAVNVIEQSFAVARARDIAVHVSLETHYFWNTRPDLFNYFDPESPGYDPGNTANVEWSDWGGTPSRARYVNHGVPVELAPHMCYLAATIQSEVSRLAGIVGAALRTELAALADTGQSDLFSGLTVTSEPSLDNYTNIDAIDPPLGQLMQSNSSPKVRFGYCSFTAAGYSAANPPADLATAAAQVNQQWVQSWANAIADSGIAVDRLYTHTAAAAGAPTDHHFDLLNAPIDTAFVEQSRPGWTTYPMGSLEESFDVLYEHLAERGYPPWGGTEGAPFDGRGTTSVSEYLSRHYDHGAMVVVLNDGATGELASQLRGAIYSPEAIDAYRQFLDDL
ncbi:MAG TPA: hypothetical protein VLC93_14415 [Myxococcota bacterium]|nr:hypothetical protein [Myxococcota bacterium]